MPIYEFLCTKCQHTFDSLLEDLPIKPIRCLQCICLTASKQVSIPTIHFKGIGWPGEEIKKHGKKRT